MDADEGDDQVLGDTDVVAAASAASLTFEVPGCEDLPEKSRLALKRIAAEYAKTVLEEAGLLEAAVNPGLNDPMITPTHIVDAGSNVRNRYATRTAVPEKKSRRAKFYTGASYLIAIICGFFINNIDKPWGSIGVAVLLIAGATTFFLGEVRND